VEGTQPPTPPPADPDPSDEATAPSEVQITEAIRADILAIHRDSYGGGADRAQAHILDDTVIVMLDGLELLPNEEYLIQQGRGDGVTQLRELFQKAIEPTFTAVVERATGRRVIGFASHFQLADPPFAVEIFRLQSH
jgi:uncharacterized protein YbcI